MAINVLRAVTSLLSRAKHKLRRPNCERLLSTFSCRAMALPFLVGERKKKKKKKQQRIERSNELLDEEEEVWRRGIIMGEKCEPLNFSGVIYYDPNGRQLAEVPGPRSPMRSPLPGGFLTGEKGYWN